MLYQEFSKSKKVEYENHHNKNCSICFDVINEAVVLQCGHEYHLNCLEQLVIFS